MALLAMNSCQSSLYSRGYVLLYITLYIPLMATYRLRYPPGTSIFCPDEGIDADEGISHAAAYLRSTGDLPHTRAFYYLLRVAGPAQQIFM